MRKPDQELKEGTVAFELKNLLDGKSSKSRWLLAGMAGTGFGGAWLMPRLGLSGLQLKFGLAGLWFVAVVLLAYRESAKKTGNGQ
jgi:hypothetical protein